MHSIRTLLLPAVASFGFLGAFAAAQTTNGTPMPAATATSSASPSPSASASPGPVIPFHFITHPPQTTADPAQPQILEIDFNEQRLTAPGPLVVRVLTSPNVTHVTVHISDKSASIPAVGPGDFEANTALPDLPAFLKGKSYVVQFEAVTADGRSRLTDVSVYINR